MCIDVLGLGCAAMDIILQCENLPKEDGFAFIHKEQLMPGGSCANVLVALTNLNIKTGIVAQLGDDHYGKIFKKQLRETSVSTDYLFEKENGTSLHTFITVTKNGSKAIYANLGDSLLTLEEDKVNEKMLEGVKAFYTDMFGAKPALKLARICKEKDIPVVFNLQCAPSFMELCQVTSKELAEIMSMADIFFSCREGLLELAEVDDYQEAGKKVYEKYKPKQGLIFTVGEKGAISYINGGIMEVPALKVNSIDTTGAGDAFIGGFIYAYLLKKYDRNYSLKFANACAAKKCTQLGPRLDAKEKEIIHILNNN